MLTFVGASAKICLVLRKQGQRTGQRASFETAGTVQKNLKKVVDKRSRVCYSKRAVAENDNEP